MRPLEVWGGHECTVNRVGAVWRDQTVLAGHQDRIGDLDLFAEIGVKALRYPVLWERTERSPGVLDWAWPDERLERIRTLGIRPIAGLLHHGSGPAWTDLLDPAFADGLAAFAAKVAERYPWIDDWTPVNEPLTTARFSALYGHWYPHRRDEVAFWTALLNQIDATRLAMRAIRAFNPRARLIQTEDFGHTFATGPCLAQAEHDNQRRLMTWDLLCGRVTAGHPFHQRLCGLGFGARLARIAADPCPPVIGLNHYVTSDRFLDHRIERYPEPSRGGNGVIAYADVEAVRVIDPPPSGWMQHLAHLWDRYRRPIAITECHLGCTREEQLRWLAECWDSALAAGRRGVAVEAVTVWNLLGSYDWDSLLTQAAGRYESGAFDLSDGFARPTALAALARSLAATGAVDMPVAQEAGWWRTARRLTFPPCPVARLGEAPTRSDGSPSIRLEAEPSQDFLLECRSRGLQVGTDVDDSRCWLTVSPGHSPPLGRALDLVLDTALGMRRNSDTKVAKSL
jgi:beta-glucosidase/6-phospho-beta-glucosidase/beta-galactosidase